MKFGDLFKTVGLTTGDVIGNRLNTTNLGRNSKMPGADIDRIHHGHQRHHMLNPHQQMDMGLGPAIGNFYYPASYNMHGHRGYGLRLGHGGGGHGHGAPAAMGGGGGYGHTGYGGHLGGDSGSGGYDHGHSSDRQKKGSSVMTALTLLSFFFFINLLQGCLKEHMLAMNPTVMVMTAGARIRENGRFSEISSREAPDGFQIENIESSRPKLTVEQREPQPYSNVTRQDVKIKTKLKNDYFIDGDTFYTRIN